LRPLLTEFLSKAMSHMADKQELIMRGWNDSGMGKTFALYTKKARAVPSIKKPRSWRLKGSYSKSSL